VQDSIFKDIKPKKRLIIELLLVSYIIITFFIIIIWNVLKPNIFIKYFLVFFLLVVGINLFLNIMSIVTKRNLSTPLVINNFLTRLLFPLALSFGKIFGIKKEKVEGSYVELNSYLVRCKKIKVSSDEILVLLPRCIQNNECKNDVILDIKNCKGCGKCDIGKINSIIKDTNIKAIVVTGGEQAREAVLKFKPKIIIAVACERELVSGIMDVSSFFVIGIINIRPFGPCFNTRVNVDRLKETLDSCL